ncbi:MAG: RNA polymerase sigma-70 factor (ECF subfamily), partial [Polaribacter sp.]
MDEQSFIKLLKQGKQSAFGLLLDEYQQKVFGTCISFVPNKEDAEDITQEVFLEVFKSISKFKGDSKLSTWIFRIATNKSLEFIRKKNTKKRFAFMQSMLGNEIALDKTSYFTEFNHPGIVLEN